ncbi:hypothetical protein BGZ83_008634 [Gryganskiella cystojenkinii]|nr:hypothetical protein BGZ83_008634 [Gryganskiella cystojenkinii]
MVKAVTSLLLLAVCAAVAQADAKYTDLYIYNNVGVEAWLYQRNNARCYFCFSKTQTAKILNQDGADVKLFSTKDCNGIFVQLKKGARHSEKCSMG